MKTKLLTLCSCIAILAACSSTPTAPPTEPLPPPSAPNVNWVPKAGDRVATNYCENCPGKTGPARIVTLTRVVLLRSGDHLVFAKEFPKNGISSSWVTKW